MKKNRSRNSIATDNQAALLKLLTFPNKKQEWKGQEIGAYYQILLLNDNDGRKVNAIIERKDNTEEMNLEILKRWLQGTAYSQEPGEPSSKFCGTL